MAFLVLPVFAFGNARVALAGIKLATLAEGIPLGITLGLLLGKAFEGLDAGYGLRVKLGVLSGSLLAGAGAREARASWYWPIGGKTHWTADQAG